MIMAIIGLLAPFIPEVLGVFRDHLDHKHEMEMLRLRGEQAKQEAMYRMEEIEISAQASELLAARRPHQSYGVQLLDKAEGKEGIVWRFAFNMIFIAFAFLDWLISSVRPVITYWAFGLYAAVKTATLYVTYQASMRFSETAIEATSKTLLNEAVFTQFDMEMLWLIIGFWFGNRLKSGRSNAKVT